jgi:hypothetical protein
VKLDGQTLQSIRILGGFFRHDNGKTEEIDKRCSSARIAFGSLRKIWSKSIPKQTKLIALGATVDASIFSGLESRSLADRHYKKLDKTRLGLLKKVMMGEATYKELDHDGNVTKYTPMSEKEIWRFGGLLLVHLLSGFVVLE